MLLFTIIATIQSEYQKGRLNINGDFLLSFIPIFNRMEFCQYFYDIREIRFQYEYERRWIVISKYYFVNKRVQKSANNSPYSMFS